MQIKVANAMVNILKEQGAQVVFGVPGGQVLYFTDALIGSGIRFVQTRHEGGAGHAADGWGRATGKPGVCLATTGPGATNLITAVGGALRDSSPMVVILFQNRLAEAGRGAAQESDHQQLFQSLVKAYLPVRHANAAVWAMREAFGVARSGKPGPVVIDFYREVIEEGECEYLPAEAENYCFTPKALPAPARIARAAAALASFDKVAVWSGNGVKMAGAGARTLALAERLGAPVVTTFNGIGGVPSGHPQVFGARTRHGTRLTRAILEEADCVLVLGSSMSGISTNSWSLQLKHIIQIDFDTRMLGRQYPLALGLDGELKGTLELLLSQDLGAGRKAVRASWLADLQERRAGWKSDVFSGPINDETASPAAPVAVMRTLSGLFHDDQMLCVDAGNPGAWSHLFDIKPNMLYMKPVNFGNMGFSLTAGLACSMAHPGREVVSMLGDGSMGMSLADLETVARAGGRQIILVLNDSAFGNIRQEELFKFGEGRCLGVDLSPVDYAQVARALGVEGESVSSAAELPAAFARARAEARPYLINVVFDGGFTIWPEAFLNNERA